jgi:hydrophobe/amphiphile efflux-3 (HAE3) family protein
LKESYFFDRLARAVASHPRFVLIGVGLISLLLAFQLPKIQADPSPQALLASADPAQQQLEDEARATFGSTDNVVVLVISTELGALRKAPLAYEHTLASALAKFPHVDRVDALTRQAWPKMKAEEGTLDDLDNAGTEDQSGDADLLGAASDLVAAVPDVFPMGIVTLSERSAGKKLEPLVAGKEVTDDDVKLIADVVGQTRVLDGRLISRDLKHLLIAVQFSDKLTRHEQMANAVESIEKLLEQNPPPAGMKVSISGLPVIRTSLVRHMRGDQGILIPGTLFASFAVLALSFRWAPAVFLPLLAVGLTALWLVGGMALCREPLNVLNNMLPALVIIIGLNEAVHIIGRYTEECRSDSDKLRALSETVRAMGAACLTTTATSAVGLLALLVSRTEMLRRFGMVGACGLFLAYAVTLLVVPSVLSLLHAPPAPEDPTRERRGLIEMIMSRTTTASLRRPWAVLTFAGVSAVLGGWVSSYVHVDTSLLDQFATDDPVFQSVQLLEHEFEGVRPLDVTLSSKRPGRMFEPDVLRAIHRVTDWAAKQKAVIRASDVTEPIAGSWAAMSGRPFDVNDALRNKAQVKAITQILSARDATILHPLLTQDGRRTRLRIKLTDVGSHKTKLFVGKVKTKLGQELAAFPDVKASFGGDAYLTSSGLDAVVADLSGSVLVAALVIFMLLAVLLRDYKLALLAIPANLLPQVWTMAWMVMRGISLSAATAIIFSLSIGLAVDGSIHLVSRFQEERAHGILTTSALVRAVRGSGRNIVVSSVALLLGFSAILLSNFVPVQRFAELIIVSMTASMFATLIIQPVLLRVFLAKKTKALPLP